MRQITLTKNLSVPVDTVWSVLSNPRQRVDWVPGDAEVLDVQGAGEVGTRWTQIADLYGEPTVLTHTVVEVEPLERWVVEDSEGTRTTWWLAEQPGGAWVTVCERAPAMDAWPAAMWPVIEASALADKEEALLRLASLAGRVARPR